MKRIVATLLVAVLAWSAAQTLNVVHYFDPLGGSHLVESLAWLDEITAAFEAEHGVTVAYDMFAWDEIDTRMIVDQQAGVGHDVTFVSSQITPRHAAAGSLQDLSEFIAAWPADERADLDWSPVWEGGYPYGIPTGVHIRLVAYRTDLFEEAGIAAPATTLDELIDHAQQLTRDTNGDGQTDTWGLGIYLGPQRATAELAFIPMIWHFGGQAWDASTGRATFADEAGVQAAQFLHDLVHVHQVTPPWVAGGNYDDVVLRGFVDGTFAMVWGYGSYWISVLEAEGMIEGCWPATTACATPRAGVFVTPTDGGAQFGNSWLVGVHGRSQQPELAFRYVEAMTAAGTLEGFADGGLPARRSAWEDPRYGSAFYDAWFDAIDAGRAMPATTRFNELADAMTAALAEIVVGGAPVEATLQRYQDEYNAAYEGE